MATDPSKEASPRRHVVEYDESRFPLVIVTPRGEATDAEVAAFLDVLKRPLLRRQTYLQILDATHATPGTPYQRRIQAEWVGAHAPLIKRYTLGVAFVMPSPLIRGALTAILWFQRLPCPHLVMSTMDEAERWAIDRLRAAGLQLPPAPASVADGHSDGAR